MKNKKPSDPFRELSWDDLKGWAGSTIVSRGRTYQRGGSVSDLACTKHGGLIAWVEGTRRYATRVDMDGQELTSVCSCPYWTTCKHAVAVVCEYLECLKQDTIVPTITDTDQRLTVLENIADQDEDDDDWDNQDGQHDEYDEDEEDDEDEDDVAPAQPVQKRSGKSTPDSLSSFLAQQSKDQLVALLTELAQENMAVRRTLKDRQTLTTGSIKKLIKAARAEIDGLGGEPDWEYDSYGDGYYTDSSDSSTRIRKHMEALLAKGHADDVLDLGKDLVERGTKHIEMTRDEGEAGEEIATCLDMVFRALPQSSLSTVDQILWVIDAESADEYDLCRGSESFWKQKHTAADWSTVADTLAQRLKKYPSGKEEKDAYSFSRNYKRDGLSNRLIQALEQANRQAEIIPLCEREARETGSYVRLVNYLQQAKRWTEAEEWIHTGIAATQQQSPGIAEQLRTALREMRAGEKDWPRVAAFYAEDFFRRPDLHTFQELQKAAEKAKVWPAVEAATRHYLETGDLPQTKKRTKKARSIPPWPLPESGVQTKEQPEHFRPSFPLIGTLIDLAIYEKRPDEVLQWYDQREPRRAVGWGYGMLDDNRVAEAVVDSHPDRALAIWKKMAEGHIAVTNVKAYESAAVHLRKVHRTLKKLKRAAEWKTYLADLKEENKRKRRLVEILDGLEGRPIIG